MIEVASSLLSSLKEKRVSIKVHDHDTILLHQVPTCPSSFNKPYTNLLVKRNASSTTFIVGFDADLKYIGRDLSLRKAFSDKPVCRDGWQIVCLQRARQRDFELVMRNALALVGFDGKEPVLHYPGGITVDQNAGKHIISTLGISLTQLVKQGNAPTTVAREGELEDAICCLRLWDQPKMVLIAGESGVGKTNLLYGIATECAKYIPVCNLIRIDLSDLMAGACTNAEHEALLTRLLAEVGACADTIVALENIDLILVAPHGNLMLAQFVDRGNRLIGTMVPKHLRTFFSGPLDRRTQALMLQEMTPSQCAEVLATLKDKIAQHHKIEIDKSCIPACVRAAHELSGYLPAKAIELLDVSASTAALEGATILAPDNICCAAAKLKARACVGESEEPLTA